MEHILNYSSDSESVNKHSDIKWVSTSPMSYSKETNAPTSAGKRDPEPTPEAENVEEFQDLHELAEAEGLVADQDLDITDLENEQKRK